MRKDPTASSEFLRAKSWQRSNHSADPVRENTTGDGPKFVSHSLSGGERNHLFIQSDGNFANLTELSGADMKGDARSFALLDYDRDGWLDLALANPAAPRTQLFRNRMSGLVPESRKRFCISLLGGNHSAHPSVEWSARDGYGAIVKVVTSKRQHLLGHQAGEGLSAQNTDKLSIGLTQGESIRLIEVYWSSGKASKITAVPESQHEILIKESNQP